MRVAVYRRLLNALNNSVVNFGMGVMLLMAGSAIAGGSFSVGDFALFISYLWFTTQVPSEIGTFYGDYKTQAVSIERLLELVRPEPPAVLVEAAPHHDRGAAARSELSAVKTQQRPAGDAGSVTNLSYRYPDAEKGRGMTGVNLELRRGDFVVITGQMGSGKTTLLAPAAGRAARPDSGEMHWNGQPVIHDPAAFFRAPRDGLHRPGAAPVFRYPAREYPAGAAGSPAVDLPGAAIQRAGTRCGMLDHGLDTLVGPRGVRLSGGQVQRAAAARMFVRSAELLVFDDLSSALDVETERVLWERL